jgi:hypothetical protein
MALTAIPAAGSKLRGGTLNSLITEVRGVYARKTANETVTNSNTLQNDDHLFVALAANAVYDWKLILHYNSGTTPDFKLGWSVPSGTTMVWGGMIADTAGAVTSVANLSQTTVQAIGGTGAANYQFFTGVVVTSTTAGTLQLQWAQNTTTLSDTILLAGSELILTRTS